LAQVQHTIILTEKSELSLNDTRSMRIKASVMAKTGALVALSDALEKGKMIGTIIVSFTFTKVYMQTLKKNLAVSRLTITYNTFILSYC
jgi:hypothetical protein